MGRPIRINAVECLGAFRVRLTFTNNTQKDVDLEPYLRGPVFQPLRDDPQAFAAVKVDPRFGTIVWPNGADIDPDVLYHSLQPAWMTADERQESRESLAHRPEA